MIKVIKISVFVSTNSHNFVISTFQRETPFESMILKGYWANKSSVIYMYHDPPQPWTLYYRSKESKTLSNYLEEIPENATQQNMFAPGCEGKPSETFRPYQFVLQEEKLTHR